MMVSRLELLGCTPEVVELKYLENVSMWSRSASPLQPPTFQKLLSFLSKHPLGSLDNSCIDYRYEAGSPPERFVKDAFVLELDFETSCYSEAQFMCALLRALLGCPHLVLRALAMVQANENAEVVWDYGQVVDTGWAEECGFKAGVPRELKTLIATEGTSDIHILKKALTLLMPEISDFFRFIDVSERHPFSGASNLATFAEGAVAIDLQNRVIFVFDNDAEGRDALARLACLELPSNMRAIALPELEEFRTFATLGPTGLVHCDINGRAVAIECYLDLELEGMADACIVWTNKKSNDSYQGSLEYKDSYVKHFKKQTAKSIALGGYNAEKLKKLLSHILAESVSLASSKHKRVL